MASDRKITLRKEAQRVGVTRFLDHRDFLRAVYEAAKAQLDSYSYLKFAEDLGFSATNVIRLVIAGKRPLTAKGAMKIADALELKGSERRYFITLVKYAAARLPAERDQLFNALMRYKTRSPSRELDPLQMEYFSEWYNPVIREMVGLPGFDGTPEWIKQRLSFPLRLEEIKRSLELLAKIGVIHFDAKAGRWLRKDRRITTDEEVDDMAIVRYHQKMIEMGRESITRVPEDLRDIRALTALLPRSAIPRLKAKIHEWMLEALAMEEEEASADGEVFQLNIQLFPFTKT